MGDQDGCCVGNNWNWYKAQETCFTQVEHEISFKKFQPGKWAYLFRFSTFFWNFPVGRTDGMFSIFYRTKISENFDKMESTLKLTFVSEMRLELFLVFPQKLELRQFGQLHFYWNCVAVWSLLLWDHELIAQTTSHQSNCESWLLWGLPREGAGGRGGSRIFFRRGCTRLLLYFNTNKPHSFFFAEYQLY